MFAHWAGRNTVPLAQTMLHMLERAREDAQSINEAQRSHVPDSQVQPRLQQLTAQLQTIQNLDPNYRLISVGDLARTINNARQQMPAAAVPPWTNPPHRAALFPEFQRQIREQQDGINSQLCDTWEKNRQQYITQGRSALGAQLQAEFQNRSQHPPNTAAPHNADQVGGGHPDPTGVPANRQINSAIGGGWPTRIGRIDSAVNAIAPLERLVTQMNVVLSVNQI